MGIRSRVADALLLYENGHHEGAFLNALVAVAATPRRECADPNIGDRECFESFLDRCRRGVISVEFRGELHTVPHILYKWFRCQLVHEGGLPVDIEFIDSDGLIQHVQIGPLTQPQLYGLLDQLVVAKTKD